MTPPENSATTEADSAPTTVPFTELGLSDAVLAALRDVGYEHPSAIQAATIPPLLAGRDVVGLAQTGTGKTAAFALPILSRLDMAQKTPQALVLAPTRELALQVCEAFEKYAAHLPGVHVLPVYGGQGYGGVPIPDLSNSQFSMDAFYASGIRRGHPYYNRMEIFLNRTQNFPKVNDLTDKTKFPQMKNFQVQSDGGFGYAPGISKFEVDVNKEGKKFARSYASMTAAGIKSLLQIGVSKDDSRVQAALGWFQRNYTLEINYGLELPDKPEKGRQALYYFYWTYARAMSLLGEPTLKLADGTTINWAGELAGKLKSLQKADGSWKNEQSRWHEADPYLVTSYCLVALQHCRKSLGKK